MAETNKKYRRFPNLSVEEVDGELFVVDNIQNKIHSIGQVGSAVWRLLDAPHTRSECLQVFFEAFPDNNKEEIELLLYKTIDDMENKGIIYG